jgi:hypothetical protein
MDTTTPPAHLNDQTPKLRRRLTAFLIPLLVFITSGAAAAMVVGVTAALTSMEYVNARLYLFGTAGQFAMDLLPIALLIRSRRNWLGSRRDQLIGTLVGLIGAAALAAIRYAIRGRLVFMEQVWAFPQSLALAPPWNILSAALVVLAYGPGEALIQVYLITAFDDAMNHHQRLLSLGVILNALLWGLGHIFAVVMYGWSAVGNAVLMLAVGIAIGLMFKKTKSALAPIVFWTLINGTSA